MRIFITGATGFIGSRVVQELIGAGHQVLGLARSEAGATALTALGADVQRGVLEDFDVLQSGAAAADAVIHCGFNHDHSSVADFIKNCETDRRAIEAIGSVLAGSDRFFLVSSGLAGLSREGETPTEQSIVPHDYPLPRVSEPAALALEAKGVRVAVMRLPQVHNTVKQGLVTYAIALAREKGISAYVGDGNNFWAAAHVDDVARLYRLAVEQPVAGARWHAVAEERVPYIEIARSISAGLGVKLVSLAPEEAVTHFGWWGRLAGGNLTGSSLLTRERLGWNPTGPGLLADLRQVDYTLAV